MPMTSPESTSDGKWSRGRIRLAGFLLSLYAVLLLGDIAYAIRADRGIVALESTWTFDADGVRADCLARTTGEGKTALLLVHGFNDSPRTWDRMTPELVARGYLCRAMRLPGFAERHSQYGRPTTDDWLAEIRREIDRLREAGHRVVLVGHSLGGALSLRTALDAGDRLEGVVLVAPAIDVSETRSPLLPIRTWQKIAESILVFVPATASPFGVETKDPDDEPYPYRTPFTPRRVIAQTIGLIDRNAADSDKLNVPLMVAVVPDDVVVDPVATERWYERVEAPRKVRFEANRSAHPLPRDLDAPDLCRAIDEFVRSLE
jgi:carboxylesterase